MAEPDYHHRGHCKWCGRFLKNGTMPIYGKNRHNVLIGQLLCPECGPQWKEMAAKNEEWLERNSWWPRKEGENTANANDHLH